MINDKYVEVIGKKFGELTLETVDRIPGKIPKRTKYSFNFVCSCGTRKTYDSSGAANIFKGSTISCGCIRKKKWARAYYAWKKQNSRLSK